MGRAGLPDGDTFAFLTKDFLEGTFGHNHGNGHPASWVKRLGEPLGRSLMTRLPVKRRDRAPSLKCVSLRNDMSQGLAPTMAIVISSDMAPAMTGSTGRTVTSATLRSGRLLVAGDCR